MIDFIQYFDTKAGSPSALAAWSFKKNSGFDNVKAYLYTPYETNFDDPLLNAVFDEIRELPSWSKDVDELDWSLLDGGDTARKKSTWSKMLSWAFHPVPKDGEVWMYDYDAICVKSMTHYTLKQNQCWKSYRWFRGKGFLTAGASFVTKNSTFDEFKFNEYLLDILHDTDLFMQDKYKDCGNDDRALTILCDSISKELTGWLPEPANRANLWNYEGATGIHYRNDSKPWLENTTCPPTPQKLWFEMRNNMLREYDLMDYNDICLKNNPYLVTNLKLGML